MKVVKSNNQGTYVQGTLDEERAPFDAIAAERQTTGASIQYAS